MNVVKENKAMSLTVTEGLTVQIIPNPQHEFLMDSKQVALGYGVSYGNIREHKRVNDEFIEGKHFLIGVRISDSEPNNKVYWTKRGIVRLGFFIKSKNAKLFRDWAEDLIINKLGEQTTLFDLQPKLLNGKRLYNGNRLTPARMVDILHEVCKIEDAQLRATISNKLKGGSYGN
jgi:hypothetical protein